MITTFHGLVIEVGCARQVHRYASEHVARLQAEISSLEAEHDMLRALEHRPDFGRLTWVARQHICRRDVEVGVQLIERAREELDFVWRPLMDAQAPFCENCMGNGVTMVGYGGEGTMVCGNCGGTGVEP